MPKSYRIRLVANADGTVVAENEHGARVVMGPSGPHRFSVVGISFLNVRTVLYIAIAVILLLFGDLALFSIGWPFALTGILMLALIGQRHRFDMLAPALAWPWVFTIGYLLVAPIGCTSTAVPSGTGPVEGGTRCDSLFLTYAGPTPYRPPVLPAILTGVALATAASLAIQWELRRRRRNRSLLDTGVARP